MKTITVEIDNTYADIMSITLVGYNGGTINVTTAVPTITDGMKLNVDADGKITEKTKDIGTVDDFKDLKAGAENLNLKGDEILLKPFEVKGFVYDSEEYKQLKAENESLKKNSWRNKGKKVTMMNGLLPKSRCETPIEELDLSIRPYNCLWRAGIRTIEQLQQMPEEKLLRLQNLGRKSLSEIKSKLDDFCKEEINEVNFNVNTTKTDINYEVRNGREDK